MERKKRFKIERLEKYSEEWKEEKENIKNALEVGIIGLGFLFFGIVGRMEYMNIPRDIPTECINFGLLTFTIEGAVFDYTSIRTLISSLRNKHKLENKIDAINAEIDEQEEIKIRTRGRK